MVAQSTIEKKLSAMKAATSLEEIEEDEKNAGIIFDEAQFGKWPNDDV